MNSVAWPVSRTERFLLAALLLVVPLLEVPKHLFWVAWVGVSLTMLWRGRGLGGPAQSGWQPWDALLGAVLVAALLAGAGFADPGSSLAATGDTLRLVSVPWLMARRGYRVADCLPLLWAALAGTVLATVWGFIDIFRATAPMFLELNSVGHVNHSSIYLAIAFGCALGLALADRARARGLALAAALLLAAALMATGSRASAGAAVGFVLLLGWSAPFSGTDPARAARRRLRFRVGLLVLVLAAGGVYRLATGLSDKRLQPEGQGLIEKFVFQASVGAPTSHRDGLLRLALAAAGAHPLVGLGNGGFRRLTPERVCAEIIVPPAGQPCDTARYFFSSHAHSLYANTLAERGLVGLAALLALLGAWALRLRRTLDWARANHRQAGIWVASLAGLSVTAFAGLLNTSLHHEHGLLAMATLGMLLAASAPPRGAPA